jgi:hypothetical protein
MEFFTGFGRWKSSLGTMSLARILAVMGAGTLGQRVTLLVGAGVIAYASFQALPWFGLAFGGGLLCWFAVRDFDRMNPR